MGMETAVGVHSSVYGLSLAWPFQWKYLLGARIMCSYSLDATKKLSTKVDWLFSVHLYKEWVGPQIFNYWVPPAFIFHCFCNMCTFSS